MKRLVNEAEFSPEQLNSISALAQSVGLCEDTVSILYGRGIDTEDKIKAYINPGKHLFLSPYLMKGMKEAVRLITRAKEEGWSVVVYGDYDADGVCASTIMCRVLSDFGLDCFVYVPERREGYGLNTAAIDSIFEEYFPQLFITVDCGISNNAEIEYIKEQGAEVIVTDHHELPGTLPDCICVNPKIDDEYPYDNLCGAGVAFKVGCALNGKDAYKYLDFAAIATVADSVPLTGENRSIVAEGLKLINSSPRKNYSGFFKNGEKVTAQTLAYSVAPKINAAGRMGNANAALTLFLSDDESEIYDYTVRLSAYNVERQKSCDELYLSAKSKLKEKGANGRVIVLWDESWNAGFVGIVAARLAEEYCRPTLLFVKNGEYLKGSARSVDGVNIFAALKSCSHLISEFGGHSQAAGVNVEESNLQALESALNSYLHENYSAEEFTPTYYINGVYRDHLDREFVKELELLEPCGVGNRKPQFALDVTSCRVRPLKQGSAHLSVKCDGLELIWFSGSKYAKIMRSDVPKRVVFEYNISTFRGKEQIKGYLRDVVYQPSGCMCAAEGVGLNDLALASYGEVDCRVRKISAARAQEEIYGRTEYGSVFIAYSLNTLKKFDIKGLEVNVFNLSASSLTDVLIISPAPECDLSAYEKIVFLDDPVRITLPSLKGKTVLLCDENCGVDCFGDLSAYREDLLSVFKLISANSYRISGGSAEEAATENDFGVPPMQALFTLKVFEQLNLISFDGGRLTVYRGMKTQLNNSELYNFIVSFKNLL